MSSVQFSNHDLPIATTREGYIELGHQPQPILAAIRAKCIDCSGGSPNEVKLCRSVKCALFPFRMNSNPWRKEVSLSPERRAAAAEHLSRLRTASKVAAE
jgi:hypothetical protein